jgi:hypothetical protein
MLYLLKQDRSIMRLKEACRMSLKLNASKNAVNQMKRLQGEKLSHRHAIEAFLVASAHIVWSAVFRSFFVLEEMMVNRKAGGSAARIDSQFAINRLGMAINCVGTQDQLFGNLMIAQALRKQAQHLDFPCGQPARKGR